MSNKHSEDAEDFTLSLKWKPGADLMSKLLLGDPKVINVVVRSLVGTDVPANSYAVAQTEWTDGSRSDVIYASRVKTTESLPPILLELQYQVNQDFMLRLIKYTSNTYKCYKVLPIVLVIVTKSFSSAAFQREFTTSSKGFLPETSCKFWAKQCALLTANAVSDHLHQATLDPMAALGYFLTRHRLHQMRQHYRSDPILMLLSFAAKEILSKEGNEGINNQALFTN